jgi:hypothetical protein
VMILSGVHGVANESQDIHLSSWTNETYTENDRIASPSTFCEKSFDPIQKVFRTSCTHREGSTKLASKGTLRSKILYMSKGFDESLNPHRESDCSSWQERLSAWSAVASHEPRAYLGSLRVTVAAQSQLVRSCIRWQTQLIECFWALVDGIKRLNIEQQ